MTPAEEAHLCACETLALADHGHSSTEELLAALRCIRNILAADIKPSRVRDNESKALINIYVYGKD